MLDLSKYSSYPKHKSVIAWPVEHNTVEVKGAKHQDLTFKILAFYVVENDHGKAWREMWEKLNVQASRQARKEQKEQRMAARQQVHWKDEL